MKLISLILVLSLLLNSVPLGAFSLPADLQQSSVFSSIKNRFLDIVRLEPKRSQLESALDCRFQFAKIEQTPSKEVLLCTVQTPQQTKFYRLTYTNNAKKNEVLGNHRPHLLRALSTIASDPLRVAAAVEGTRNLHQPYSSLRTELVPGDPLEDSPGAIEEKRGSTLETTPTDQLIRNLEGSFWDYFNFWKNFDNLAPVATELGRRAFLDMGLIPQITPVIIEAMGHRSEKVRLAAAIAAVQILKAIEQSFQNILVLTDMRLISSLVDIQLSIEKTFMEMTCPRF